VPDCTTPTGAILSSDYFLTPLQDVHSAFERLNAYGYLHWQALDTLRLTGGVTYDRLTYPVNFRFAPISVDEVTIDQVSPKVGLILTPWTNAIVRAAYSRSLGGVSLDQSFELEPTHVSGLNQSWRSAIPESVTGANAAERFETWGAALDLRLPTRTYLGVSIEWLGSTANRTVGLFDEDLSAIAPPFIFQSGIRQDLEFAERTLSVIVNQLAGRRCAFGVRYRLSRAELTESFPEVPASATLFGGLRREQRLEAVLHAVNLFANWMHPNGCFAQVDSIWSVQSNRGYSPDIPGDNFWQFNAQVGYRFPRRRAEVRLGLLNITDRDYRLNPLNLTSELPRKRTLAASFKWSF